MINGRSDYVFPYEESQLAMLNLLGTSVEHKTHIAVECGHGLMGENAVRAYRDAMQWLDSILGEAC